MGKNARRDIPWLKRRPGGNWFVYWYTAAGRTDRTSLRTADPVEAQARFAAFLAGGSDAFKPAAEAPGITVAGALDDYWREHVAEKVVDKERQADVIIHLKAFFGGTKALADIDIPASRAYAAARRRGDVGGGLRNTKRVGTDSTIRRELVVIQAAANHALRWKRIAPAEMPSIELPQETPRGEPTWLTREELARLIETASEPLRSFIELAYYTGARRRSVEGLTRFQVDLARGRINLTGANETGAERRSKKRRPIVPIDPKMRPALERLIAAAAAVGSGPLFSGSMYKRFKIHARAIGLPEHKTHPHVLRHSRATHLLQDGVSIYDVGRLLGDTIATVERVYGHHSTDYLAAAISRAGAEKGKGQ